MTTQGHYCALYDALRRRYGARWPLLATSAELAALARRLP